MKPTLLLPALLAGAVLLSAVGAQAASKAPTPAQKQTLSTCAACHDITGAKATQVGPPLFGVMGAKPRSPGMPVKKWDKKSLDAFLADPGTFKPGSTMPVNVEDPKERKAIVEALAGLK
jgi:cytochrome c2